jgi:hypothetical protein
MDPLLYETVSAYQRELLEETWLERPKEVNGPAHALLVDLLPGPCRSRAAPFV